MTRVMPKPERPSGDFLPADSNAWPDVVHAHTVPGCRLYGAADINGVRYWFHPPSDQLIRADLWWDIVGDPDKPEPLSESLCD